MTNPLAPTPDQDAAVRATRLYTLIRDAYLALPQITRRKLDALADLQLATARPAAACTHIATGGGLGGPVGAPGPIPCGCGRAHTSTSGQPGQPGQSGEAGLPVAAPAPPAQLADGGSPGELGGVRLVEWLRQRMHESSAALGPQESALTLLDVMVSTAPPRHESRYGGCGAVTPYDWSVDPVSLFVDAGGYVAPQLATGSIQRLARLHRQSRRFLTTGSRLAINGRALGDCAGPEDAIADMLESVLGVNCATARAAACVALDGGSLDRSGGLAGGALFVPLSGFGGPEAFVGTRLSHTAPSALVHHLASLECALRVRPGSAQPVGDALEALREDIAAMVPVDPDMAARLRAGRRAVELTAVRCAAGAERGRRGARVARRRLGL